jgi:branched-chain amino acid transport system ATP-binding protein
MQLLEVNGLVSGYGRTQVLKEVSITVDAGEALAVLGANGAGKTTLMKTIAGLVRPWSGTITFDGEDLSRIPAEERSARGLVLAPEGREIFTTMSIEENLLLGATPLRKRHGRAEARASTAESLEHVYGMFSVLRERRKDLASKLSGGQQQMLAIARALMARPKLLLMDEPCLGLSPKLGNDVYAYLRLLREQGQSIVVVEESSRRALGFADRACVLKLGQKMLEDRAETMAGDDRLLEAYFGVTAGGKEQAP